MTTTKAITVLTLLLLMALSGVNTSATQDEPRTIGYYSTVDFEEELTEDHLKKVARGHFLDAPDLATSVRIDQGYLRELLPGWGASNAYEVEDNYAVFDGEDTFFERFEHGSDPVYTQGSEHSIMLDSRPMWLSASHDGLAITLDIEDIDTTGQRVVLNQTYLSGYGIDDPVFVHEDGTVLNNTYHSGRYIVDVHHFSLVLVLDQDDFAVQGRQAGLVFPHEGEVRWLPDDLRMEIDVDPQLVTYEVLAPKNWFREQLPYPKLDKYVYSEEVVDGIKYYVAEIQPEDTPLTLSWQMEWYYDVVNNSIWREPPRKSVKTTVGS